SVTWEGGRAVRILLRKGRVRIKRRWRLYRPARGDAGRHLARAGGTVAKRLVNAEHLLHLLVKAARCLNAGAQAIEERRVQVETLKLPRQVTGILWRKEKAVHAIRYEV